MKYNTTLGEWLSHLRNENKENELDISIIEEKCGFDKNSLIKIEEGKENIDYIQLNKLCAIYIEDLNNLDKNLIKFTLNHINNQLPITYNSNIIYDIKKNTTLKINYNAKEKSKKIIINDKEFILVSLKENNVIKVKFYYNLDNKNITEQHIITINQNDYDYNDLLDHIMYLYRVFYFKNIKPIIINESIKKFKKEQQKKSNDFALRLFEEL